MVCRMYQEREAELEAYLDGQLLGAEAATLETHLAGCPTCREALDEARTGGALVRAAILPTPDPGGAFWLRVQARIRGEEERLSFWKPLEIVAWRVSWSAAVALALLVGYVLSIDFRPESRDIPAAQREIFQEPTQPPTDGDEVLLTLANRGNGR